MSQENNFYGAEDGSFENGSNKSILPIKLGSFKNMPKKAQIGIIAAAASVAVALVVVLIVLFVKSNNIENNSILVYKKGTECVVRIKDKELVLPDRDVVDFKADAKVTSVYYTVPSS